MVESRMIVRLEAERDRAAVWDVNRDAFGREAEADLAAEGVKAPEDS